MKVLALWYCTFVYITLGQSYPRQENNMPREILPSTEKPKTVRYSKLLSISYEDETSEAPVRKIEPRMFIPPSEHRKSKVCDSCNSQPWVPVVRFSQRAPKEIKYEHEDYSPPKTTHQNNYIGLNIYLTTPNQGTLQHLTPPTQGTLQHLTPPTQGTLQHSAAPYHESAPLQNHLTPPNLGPQNAASNLINNYVKYHNSHDETRETPCDLIRKQKLQDSLSSGSEMTYSTDNNNSYRGGNYNTFNSNTNKFFEYFSYVKHPDSSIKQNVLTNFTNLPPHRNRLLNQHFGPPIQQTPKRTKELPLTFQDDTLNINYKNQYSKNYSSYGIPQHTFAQQKPLPTSNGHGHKTHYGNHQLHNGKAPQLLHNTHYYQPPQHNLLQGNMFPHNLDYELAPKLNPSIGTVDNSFYHSTPPLENDMSKPYKISTLNNEDNSVLLISEIPQYLTPPKIQVNDMNVEQNYEHFNVPRDEAVQFTEHKNYNENGEFSKNNMHTDREAYNEQSEFDDPKHVIEQNEYQEQKKYSEQNELTGNNDFKTHTDYFNSHEENLFDKRDSLLQNISNIKFGHNYRKPSSAIEWQCFLMNFIKYLKLRKTNFVRMSHQCDPFSLQEFIKSQEKNTLEFNNPNEINEITIRNNEIVEHVEAQTRTPKELVTPENEHASPQPDLVDPYYDNLQNYSKTAQEALNKFIYNNKISNYNSIELQKHSQNKDQNKVKQNKEHSAQNYENLDHQNKYNGEHQQDTWLNNDENYLIDNNLNSYISENMSHNINIHNNLHLNESYNKNSDLNNNNSSNNNNEHYFNNQEIIENNNILNDMLDAHTRSPNTQESPIYMNDIDSTNQKYEDEDNHENNQNDSPNDPGDKNDFSLPNAMFFPKGFSYSDNVHIDFITEKPILLTSPKKIKIVIPYRKRSNNELRKNANRNEESSLFNETNKVGTNSSSSFDDDVHNSIDNWTADKYSNHKLNSFKNFNHSSYEYFNGLQKSKSIPSIYLNISSQQPPSHFNANKAPSITYANTIEGSMSINKNTSGNISKTWEDLQVAISPYTKEQVYVVTPKSN